VGQAAGAATSFPQTTDAPSRGALTTEFLASDVEPLAYLQVCVVWGWLCI